MTKEFEQKAAEIKALWEKILTNACGDPQDLIDMKKLKELKDELALMQHIVVFKGNEMTILPANSNDHA